MTDEQMIAALHTGVTVSGTHETSDDVDAANVLMEQAADRLSELSPSRLSANDEGVTDDPWQHARFLEWWEASGQASVFDLTVRNCAFSAWCAALSTKPEAHPETDWGPDVGAEVLPPYDFAYHTPKDGIPQQSNYTFGGKEFPPSDTQPTASGEQMEVVCAIIAPDLFSDDEQRRHMAASPLKVDVAQASVIEQARAILSALGADARIWDLTESVKAAEAEIERMTPKFVAYEYLESPAGRETAEAELQKLKTEPYDSRDGLSKWQGWDQSRLPWSDCKHKDSVLHALFQGPWSMEDADALIGFIDRTWGSSDLRPEGAQS